MQLLENSKFRVALFFDKPKFQLDSADSVPYEKLFNPLSFKKRDYYSSFCFVVLDEFIPDDELKQYVFITSPYFYNSILLKDNELLVLLETTIITLDLTKMEINLIKCFSEQAFGCYFSIQQFDDGYIIHGELEIIKLDKEFNKLWEFSYKDIFVNLSDEETFKIIEDKIYLTDWNNDKITLDKNGNVIEVNEYLKR